MKYAVPATRHCSVFRSNGIMLIWDLQAEEFENASSLLSKELKKALDFSIENVRRFHERQKPHGIEPFEISPGIFAGEKVTPIESLGIYVPRGRGSFPSMLYMTAVPALVAGVERICVVTPPAADGSGVSLRCRKVRRQ